MPAESHILDGLNLSNGTSFVIADTPVFVPAPVRLEMVGGVDSDGTIPVDAGRSDNATLTLPLRVKQQATADLAWQKVGLIVAKLDQSRRNRDGLTHLWRPQDMTSTWELTVRSGEIAEFPMNDRDQMMGYLRRMHRITIVLQCDPFLYKQGEVVNYTEVTSTEPVFSIVLANVPGHVEAEATVTVTDNATQARRHVEGGLGEDSAAPLLIDSASMTLLGSTATTRTGAYSASGVLRATLATQPQAAGGTGNLAHVGVHRPKARVWASSTDVRLRLAYRTADGAYSYTPWIAPPVASAFCEVAFGVITIGKVTNGAQQWDGRIEAYSNTVGDTLDTDYFEMLPADRWWKVAAASGYLAGTLVGRDEFTGIIAGGLLGARVAPSGGAWATSGATTDFVATDAPAPAETMSRATVTDSGSGRLAILGAANYTTTEVGVTTYGVGSFDPMGSGTGQIDQVVIARYVDASNYFEFAVVTLEGLEAATVLNVATVLAGVRTGIAGLVIGPQTGSYRMVLIAMASGAWVAHLMTTGGAIVTTLSGTHTALATGGVLATGKPGMRDFATVSLAPTRYYDNFYAAVPPAEPITINSSRAIELRHNAAERQSSDGATWGTVTPRGGRVYVPCAGPEARVTRLWSKARRNDVDTAPDDNIADSTKLKVALRPRYRLPAT